MALEPTTPKYTHRKELILSGKPEDLEEYLRTLNDQLKKRDDDIRRALVNVESRFIGYSIDFTDRTGTFTVGNGITGGTSGATADIVWVAGGASGTLTLENISGTFQEGEVIYEAGLGSEMLIDGVLELWTGDDPDEWETSVGLNDKVYQESVIVHGGTYSCECYMADGGVWIQQLSTDFVTDYVAGSHYKLDVWLYGDASNSIRIVDFYALPDNPGIDEIVIPPAAWTQYEFYFTAIPVISGPSGSDRIKILRATPVEQYWTYYIDDISLKPVTNAARTSSMVY